MLGEVGAGPARHGPAMQPGARNRGSPTLSRCQPMQPSPDAVALERSRPRYRGPGRWHPSSATPDLTAPRAPYEGGAFGARHRAAVSGLARIGAVCFQLLLLRGRFQKRVVGIHMQKSMYVPSRRRGSSAATLGAVDGMGPCLGASLVEMASTAAKYAVIPIWPKESTTDGPSLVRLAAQCCARRRLASSWQPAPRVDRSPFSQPSPCRAGAYALSRLCLAAGRSDTCEYPDGSSRGPYRPIGASSPLRCPHVECA